ncbi:hypothetical protein ACFFX1_23755, partial [Dactylosporangium sucinum]
QLDDIKASEIESLVEEVKAARVLRSNGRGGHSSAENMITALRCLYRRAVADGYLTEAQNPALKVAKPKRLQSTRRALADTRLAEINAIAGTTGDDPALDAPLIRLHTETACRRGGAQRGARTEAAAHLWLAPIASRPARTGRHADPTTGDRACRRHDGSGTSDQVLPLPVTYAVPGRP